MENFKIKLILAAWGSIVSLLLVGCNTVEGVGTDIKHAGRAIEGAAESAKEPCSPTVPCPRTQSQSRRR
ncbi:MAG: entericidin A/B family lipoprotein [Chlamydiota bacterium]